MELDAKTRGGPSWTGSAMSMDGGDIAFSPAIFTSGRTSRFMGETQCTGAWTYTGLEKVTTSALDCHCPAMADGGKEGAISARMLLRGLRRNGFGVMRNGEQSREGRAGNPARPERTIFFRKV